MIKILKNRKMELILTFIYECSISLETKSTPPDVKDEDEKADIKSTGYNTNRIQCHNPDKEETNDDQS